MMSNITRGGKKGIAAWQQAKMEESMNSKAGVGVKNFAWTNAKAGEIWAGI